MGGEVEKPEVRGVVGKDAGVGEMWKSRCFLVVGDKGGDGGEGAVVEIG